MQKKYSNVYQKGTLFFFFAFFAFFIHKIKSKTLNKNLRHSSLDMNVMYMHEKIRLLNTVLREILTFEK